MQGDQLDALDIGHPLRVPLHRDKTVIVQRIEGAHHRVDRQAALADETVLHHAVNDVGILQVHMFDIGAEILDRFFRRLARVAEGMLHIPERGEVVAGEGIEHIAEFIGIGKYPYGLDQQRHAGLLRGGQHFFQHPHHRGALIRERTSRILRAEAHIGYAQALRGIDIIHDLGAVVFKLRAVCDIMPGVDAGDRKPSLGHLAVRGVGPCRVKDTVFLHERRLVDIVYLYPREAAVFGDGAEVLPCIVMPPESRK